MLQVKIRVSVSFRVRDTVEIMVQIWKIHLSVGKTADH